MYLFPAKRASDPFPERSEKSPGSDNFFSKKCVTLSLYQKSGESIPGFIFLLIYKNYAQVITFLRHAMYFPRPLKCAEINFRCPAEKIAGRKIFLVEKYHGYCVQ